MIAYASIPALVALVLKFVLAAYVVFSPTHNSFTRVFLALLATLTLLNLDEFLILNYLPGHGITPLVQAAGFLYVALWGPIVAILLHLSLVLSTDKPGSPNAWFVVALYAAVAPVEYLLFFTDKLVLSFRPFLYSIMRVPGPWYWIAESFAILYLAATLVVLIYGARGSRPALGRTRNRLWMLALTPLVTLAIYLISAHHFGWYELTFPVYIPIAVTFFLLMTTYATHERPRRGGFYRFLYRVFDLDSYLPGSKAHRRKIALRKRIRETFSNMPALHSTRSIVKQLSQTLQCPVALVDRQFASEHTDDATQLAGFPREELPMIHRIVVAHQVRDQMPRTSALMARHRIAAIVPFHPHSRAAKWMLLGREFNEQVYTPADFDVVKLLFERLADHLIDEQMRPRAELNTVDDGTTALYGDTTRPATRSDVAANANDVLSPNGPGLRMNRSRTSQPTNGARHEEIEDIAFANGKTLAVYVAELEQRMIANALQHCRGNQSKAAELLGLRPNTLHYKIQRYGLGDYKKDG